MKRNTFPHSVCLSIVTKQHEERWQNIFLQPGNCKEKLVLPIEYIFEFGLEFSLFYVGFGGGIGQTVLIPSVILK